MKHLRIRSSITLVTLIALGLNGCGGGGGGSSDDDTSPNDLTGNVARGALVYEDWTAVMAGGSGTNPQGESVTAYVACVSCHGWDQLGELGGFARQPRTADQPNAGYGDGNTATRNISLDSIGQIAAMSEEELLQRNLGRSWSEGSASWDGGATGYSTGNQHPDYTQDGGLTLQQAADLLAFLSHADYRADQVFASIDPTTDPVSYSLRSDADAERGRSFYISNCVACHASPSSDSTALSNNKPGSGGLVAFIESDGAQSKFMHRVLWGSPHTNEASPGSEMTRAVVGSPTPLDVADLLAYLQSLNTEPNPDPDPDPDPTPDPWASGDVAIGETMWDGSYWSGVSGSLPCYSCHDGDLADVPAPELAENDLTVLGDGSMSWVPVLSDQKLWNLQAYIATIY